MSVSHSPKHTRQTRVVRRKRRPWFAKKHVTRLLLRTVVVGVALVLGFSVVNKIFRPIHLVSVEKREKARVVRDYLALKKQNQDLRRQLHYLQTPEGIAQEARKQGYVKPGEISLVIPEQKPTH